MSSKYNNDFKHWKLFCMGKIVYCNITTILYIRDKLVSISSVDPNMATLHINASTQTVLLSITSGVLLKKDANNMLFNSMSVLSSDWPDNKCIPTFPNLETSEGFKFYFSSYFQLTPYIAFDRPPRTLISSVQSIQVVATPYGAGTSSVAPTHTSKPLVSTPFVEELLNPTVSGSDCNLADLIPGEDLVVCFANFNDTNEDSIMMSKSAADRGLFAHMAYSSHVIKNSERIPNDGEYANINDHRWWKCYSRNIDVVTTPEKYAKSRHFVSGGDGRGKVISRSVTQTGEISVKVLRYSTPVTGDKLASGHGQKGVIKLIDESDMPWGIDENCEPIKFDIIISLSSIVNRVTIGQYYEMVSGIEAVRESRRLIISPQESHTHYIGKKHE